LELIAFRQFDTRLGGSIHFLGLSSRSALVARKIIWTIAVSLSLLLVRPGLAQSPTGQFSPPVDPAATLPEAGSAGNQWLFQESAAPPATAPPDSQPSATDSDWAPGVFSNSRLQLSGNISIVGIAGTDRAFVPWNPLFMLPASPFGLSTNTLEIHGRQSSLQAIFQGPQIGEYQTGALFKVYLLANSLTSDTYGLLPVVAFGEIKNDRWRFSGGLQPDLFAPRDPFVIPNVLLGGSGNPGTFRGQLRAERTFWNDDTSALKLQFALSDPLTTILIDSSRRTTESNGWPNVEARLPWSIGPEVDLAGGRTERVAELAVAGVVGQIRTTRLVFDLEDLEDPTNVRNVIDVWGLSVDGKWNIGPRWGVAGEFFTGQAIGNYAANIFQSFNPDTFQPVRGSGGWGELFFYLTDRLHVHSGYGIESPQRAALPIASGIARNETWYTNWVWDMNKTVQLSFEVDYRQTDFVSLQSGSGALFISQFLWRF
jgi:hypothetical protein